MRVTWDAPDPLIVERKAKREIVVAGTFVDHLGTHPTTKVVDGMDRWCVGCGISSGVTHFMTDEAELQGHLDAHVRVEEEAAKAALEHDALEHDAHELVIEAELPPAPPPAPVK